jgi:hypothetical protein
METTTTVKAAAAAMELSLSRRGRRGDCRRHSKRSDGRHQGLLDRIAHWEDPPVDRPTSPRPNSKTMPERKKF